MLIDTDIIIDCLRGYVPALQFVRSMPEPFSISAITVAEIVPALRDSAEKSAFASLLATVQVLPVDGAIAERAGSLFKQYRAAIPGLSLADSIIAATAERNNVPLVALDARNFPTVKKVITPYRKT